MKTVVFAHGKESGPQGTKIDALSAIARQHGWQTLAPDFRGMEDPQERVAALLTATQDVSGPLALVGSSMGGYVVAEASRALKPAVLMLLAPAVGIPFYPNPDPLPVAGELFAVHGWQDEIIPLSLVINWCQRHQVPLQLVNDKHSLQGSLLLLELQLSRLLTSVGQQHQHLVPLLS